MTVTLLAAAGDPGEEQLRRELLLRFDSALRQYHGRRIMAEVPTTPFGAIRRITSQIRDREVAIFTRRLPELAILRAAGIADDRLRWIAPITLPASGLSEFEGIRVQRTFGGLYGLLVCA